MVLLNKATAFLACLESNTVIQVSQAMAGGIMRPIPSSCNRTVLMFLSQVLLLLLLLACRAESRGLGLGAGSRAGQVWGQGPAPPASCLDVEDAEVLQVNSAGHAVSSAGATGVLFVVP